jgi:ATP phosphoribosyltransferase
VLAELGFGRCSLKIAAPERLSYEGPQSLSGARIATSYPRLTERFLRERGIDASVVKMNGAVELAPRLQIANFVCDLVSTGATLEANGLRPVETVLESQAVLLRTRKPLDEARSQIAAGLLSRVDGVLATKESKYIMLNATEEALEQITAILPGAEAPTIVPLHGRPGHFAVHAVCQESIFWETLQKLKSAGASAILVVPIEKMMM